VGPERAQRPPAVRVVEPAGVRLVLLEVGVVDAGIPRRRRVLDALGLAGDVVVGLRVEDRTEGEHQIVAVERRASAGSRRPAGKGAAEGAELRHDDLRAGDRGVDERVDALGADVAHDPPPARVRHRADLGDQGRIGAGVGAPERRADQHRQILEPPDEVGEEAEGWPVAPMEVVDGQEQWPVRRDVRREPVEAVEGGDGGVGSGGLGAELGSLEDRPRGRGGAVEPALAGVVVVEGGLEQLTDDAEGELALELAPARGEHPDVLLRGRGAELGEQPALPDPGGTLDQREPPLAAHGLGQRGTKRLKLAVTLEEQLCPARLVHGTGTS
jgi:hypothetical protein